ncbi:unnamed protein product [Zymoseptoria tritici ST99CH_1A5]|uniref:Transcriptional coactivator p15 (PC4) C-terminal domain-containing protein n=1 Tax=Zymoseptoria tritici ST99CH_1A5 TaxID=1276529 RepID=A0A1Y6M0W5_ZYMTR|nr:unnamed protein product [Zymoseptoria tritici ST99CH_1A5]
MDVELEKMREALQALKTSSTPLPPTQMPTTTRPSKPDPLTTTKQPADPSATTKHLTTTPTKPPSTPSILTPPLQPDSTSNNPFWQISPRRRLQISDYKGKILISIREWYEKDGEVLTGMEVSLLLFLDAEGVVTVVW